MRPIPEAERVNAFREMFRVVHPGGLAAHAGFRVEATGDLPMLHYVRAVRPA